MLDVLKNKIIEAGGFVNAHAHLDRANTANYFSKEEQYELLEEKWKLVDRIKGKSDYWTYKVRIGDSVTDQIKKGVYIRRGLGGKEPVSRACLCWSPCRRCREKWASSSS